MDFDVIVVGSGPAGFEVARRVAAAGRQTAVVTETPPGGRATVGSLLPSKGWLHHAHHHGGSDDAATRTAAGRIREIVSIRVSWTRSALEELDVTIIQGSARLTGPTAVAVTEPETDASAGTTRTITGAAIVFANGSEPIFFPNVKPDGKRIIAPRHTQHLTERPKSLVMVGGGVTGVEYGSVFARMGTKVRMLSYDPLLPRSDREYVARLQRHLEELGMTIETGVAVEAVKNHGDHVTVTRRVGSTVEADYAFVATGRAGDLTFLAEGSPGLATTADGRFLEVDALGRTNVSTIFACGDVTGPPLTANKAVLQARRVAAAIIGAETGLNAFPENVVIEAVYTEPQLAQIGPVLELAEDDRGEITRKSYGSSMLGQVHGTADGEIKIYTDRDGRIRGAAAIGELASELLAPVQVAMQHGVPLQDLEAVPFAYPSVSEVVTF